MLVNFDQNLNSVVTTDASATTISADLAHVQTGQNALSHTLRERLASREETTLPSAKASHASGPVSAGTDTSTAGTFSFVPITTVLLFFSLAMVKKRKQICFLR